MHAVGEAYALSWTDVERVACAMRERWLRPQTAWSAASGRGDSSPSIANSLSRRSIAAPVAARLTHLVSLTIASMGRGA
jgi:hypothetical protein